MDGRRHLSRDDAVRQSGAARQQRQHRHGWVLFRALFARLVQRSRLHHR